MVEEYFKDKEEAKLALNIMFDGINVFTCLVCNGIAYIRYEKLYNGFMGFCPTCEDQWRES